MMAMGITWQERYTELRNEADHKIYRLRAENERLRQAAGEIAAFEHRGTEQSRRDWQKRVQRLRDALADTGGET